MILECFTEYYLWRSGSTHEAYFTYLFSISLMTGHYTRLVWGSLGATGAIRNSHFRLFCFDIALTIETLKHYRSNMRCSRRLLVYPYHSCRALSVTAFNSLSSDNNSTYLPLYEPIEGVERLENYCPGGYHPIKIGDRFRARYQVVHKLGHGSYSTTWLAYDEESKKYAAAKVCIADSKLKKEHDVLSTLAKAQFSPIYSAGKTMIPSILDSFHIHGPNGDHVCYITSPEKTSLCGAKDESWSRLFQLDVARALAAQLAIAVGYIHTRGVVHGDLHLGNILLKRPLKLDHLSIGELYEEYGTPELERVVRLDGTALPDGVPSHGIFPIWLGEASDKLSLAEAKILLTNFGEAFLPRKEDIYESHTPLVLRPPEARFEPTRPLSFPSDIWTLACSIWEIIGQQSLFEGFLATEDYMTREQVDTLGILPPEWWEKWSARHDKFHENGIPKNRQTLRTWADRFEDSIQVPREKRGMHVIEPGECEAIFSMLRPMLSFRPDDRPTAKQVLESDWMVKWALPEYYRVDGKSR
ncbi:kinase-like protein [Aspergillus sclerotioniger CBS 115572]|uniref:non-specific serine/threonine protein kinase n=1 Tax=Aspergillus sclerotioniger CBS 115572 TaxID=1450535 RepID=A0A317XD62_9EURO|nr:kinase-like protein [Aspergillus sclerotioniger CBS 115572]PWY94480.1 kinase-like protein [Aspergillus sclerotioniger CBS 115572]